MQIEMIYIRDKRSPMPKSGIVSRNMSAIRAKNTGPELMLRKRLTVAGIKGYRLHPSSVIGRPDICFIGKKVAVFVNGCFWHRCPYCNKQLPKHNKSFWKKKFTKNIERDQRKREELEEKGWTVITFWECKIKKESSKMTTKIKKILQKK